METCYIDHATNAIADLCDYYNKGMYIMRITVPPASRGKGVARRLLQTIIEDADKENVTLYLEIAQSDGLNYDQLEAWYERAGFSQNRSMGFFVRKPHYASVDHTIVNTQTEKVG